MQKEKIMIYLFLIQDVPVEDIGKIFNITRERVRQILRKTFKEKIKEQNRGVL